MTITTDTGYQAHSNRSWLWLATLPMILFILLVAGLMQQPLPWQFSWSWIPSLNINLDFRVDGLSAQMLALITGIGTLVFVYAVGYLSHVYGRQRIFLTLPFFMFAMIGAVTADNIILLFVFWELTSITSFLLVGFKHEDALTRDAARQALFVTMGGGMAMLGGLILLGDIAATWSLSGIIQHGAEYRDDPRLPFALLLVLFGAFTKSAQFPFHFWLPNAMSAPTPVSAYIHSATMVKLGIYLMARLDPAFNDILLWELTLITVGTVTALWAAVLTLRERDLKRILAYSTLSALGTMTLLIGLPSPGSGLAVAALMFTHALYKAPLFMVAGNIDHATGTRNIDHLMGLKSVMPWTATVAILAGLSMAGLPLAFGFVAKDLMVIAKEQADLIAVLSYLLLLVNASAVAVAGVAAIRIFWGPLEKPMSSVREVPWTMWFPPLFIAILGLEFEFFPDLIDPLLLDAARSISPNLQVVTIETSYEVEKLLSVTGITALIGLLVLFFWDRLHSALSRIYWLDCLGPEASYHYLLNLIKKTAARHTRLLQTGRLDLYLQITIAALLLMMLFIALQSPLTPVLQGFWSLHGWAWLIAGLVMLTGALFATLANQRLVMLMATGLVGYGAALLFLFSGAPDLAFTQFLVETVLVIFAAAMLPLFRHMPVIENLFKTPLKLLLSLLAGIGTFLLLMHFQSFPENRELFEWFSAHSLTEAKGRNVVNVIIVDFRAFDTLGEITVVAFSLLAAWPLLRHIPKTRQPLSHSLLLEKAAVPLYWLLLIASVWLLLRGHNAPGGGFIAGLVAVTASSLLAMVCDVALAKRLQWFAPLSMAMLGISLAVLSGLVGAVSSESFLQHFWLGSVSTVMLFDLGVYLTVWGSLTGYLYSLLDNTQTSGEKIL